MCLVKEKLSWPALDFQPQAESSSAPHLCPRAAPFCNLHPELLSTAGKSGYVRELYGEAASRNAEGGRRGQGSDLLFESHCSSGYPGAGGAA